MSNEQQATAAVPAEPKPANIAEMKANCPGADAEFLMAQLEAGATIEAVKTAWMGTLATRAEAADARAEAAEADAAEAKAKVSGPGVKALGTGKDREAAGAEAGGDAVAQFDAAVKEKMNTVKDRRKAINAVVRADPDLHRAYIEAVNVGR